MNQRFVPLHDTSTKDKEKTTGSWDESDARTILEMSTHFAGQCVVYVEEADAYMVYISGNRVQTASSNNNSGVFIGQQIQDGWDSISPMKTATGFSMGDFTWMPCGISIYAGAKRTFQATHDADVKNNGSLSISR